MVTNPDWPTALDTVAAESSFSGLIGIDRPGRTPVDRAIGLADRRWEVPVKPDSILAIASGTKGFTALTVMSLVTNGTLSLDSTARSILGADLPDVAGDVTVRHLLGHRSGIGDYLDESEVDVTDHVLPEPVHRYLDAEDYLPSLDGHPTVFPADERFAYNNGGFVLLAILAARAAGVPYHQLVHDRVIAPAGMVDTAFQRSDAPEPRTATNYLAADGLRTNQLHMPLRGVGDGGLFSTLADMRSFWAALLAGRIVPPDVLAEMVEPRSESPDDDRRYGLGFWLPAGGDAIQLEGYDAGISFLSTCRPSTGAVVTVISNWTDGIWPIVSFLREVATDG
ncbi:MAG TPA: serine hydrolase domain-containing protein [Candidatus Limnocylindrales bacterium]